MFLLHRIQGIVIMTVGGSLVFSKYYTGACTPPTSQRLGSREVQRDLNEALFSEYSKARNNRLFLMEIKNHLVVYRNSGDVVLFVIGDEKENMKFLSKVLLVLHQSLQTVFGLRFDETIDSRRLEEKYELLLMAVDEMIDNGLLAEDSAEEIAQAVEEVNASSLDMPAREALTRLNQLLQNSL